MLIDKTVGTSERTIGKHTLLNRILGREVGIIAMDKARPSFLAKEFTILDLCAGSGTPSPFSGESSTSIIEKHVKHLQRFNVKNNIMFCEKDPATFAKLKQSYPEWAINIDSNEIKEIPFEISKNSAVFIQCDPNNVNQICISQELLEKTTSFTTILITMGCNVCGLKMLSFEKRKSWYEKLAQILHYMPSWYDAILVRLLGDKAQWAYLIIGPKKWVKDGIYHKDIQKAFKYWQSGIETAIYSNFEDFYNLQNILFLTKKEYETIKE